MKQQMKHHKNASIFPMMSPVEFEELKADISKNGVLEPATIYKGTILDGRNRQRACDELGIALPSKIYDGDDPAGYVISMNLHRRHLSESQRAMVAARMANMPKGGDRKSDDFKASIDALTQENAADLLHVSRPSVQRAKQVLEAGDEQLVAKVEAGEITVNKAITELRRKEQRETNADLAAVEPGTPGKLYNVVIIDPPWPMQKIERDVRPNQAELDYPTMTIDEIAAIDIPAAEHCHVWIWTTQKHLPSAINIMGKRAKYVCTFVWHKPGGPQPHNLPQYNCEFIVYGRIGSPTFIDTTAFNTAFTAKRAGHSVKPSEFYATVARVTDGARIDMFSRRPIPGFDAWGNESDTLD